jgi:hypothetical protein
MSSQTYGRDPRRINSSRSNAPGNGGLRVGPKLGYGAFDHAWSRFQGGSVHAMPGDLTTVQIKQHRFDHGISNVDAKQKIR